MHVRTIEGDALSLEATPESTFASLKGDIRALRGIDVIMMKLICNGRVMPDDGTPGLCGLSEDDFLVLVTAKPRPSGMMTTAAALPLSGQYYDADSDGADPSEDEVGDEEVGQGSEPPSAVEGGRRAAAALLHRVQLRLDNARGEADDDADEEEGDSMQRLAELGYAPSQVGGAMRRARHQGASHPGSACAAAQVELNTLAERLRALPAFAALQEVVRVDPQVMLVLNTEAMQFEDQHSGSQANLQASEERDMMEQAFWDACLCEVEAEVPTYDRVRQLLHEVRDTTCALLPSQWEGSEWEEKLARAAQLHDDLATALQDVSELAGEPESAPPHARVASYMRGIAEQIVLLAGPSRAKEVDAWWEAVEAAALAVICVPAGDKGAEVPSASDNEGEASPAVAGAKVKHGMATLGGCGTLGQTSATNTFDMGPPDEAPAVLLLRFLRSTFEQLQAIKLNLANAQLARLMREDADLAHIIATQPADFVSLLNCADGDAEEEEGSDGGANESMCAGCGGLTAAMRELGYGGDYDVGENAYETTPAYPLYRSGRYASSAGRHAGARGASIAQGGRSAAGAALAAARGLTQPGAQGRSSSEESDFELSAADEAGDLEGEGSSARGHSELMQALLEQWLHTPAGHEAAHEATHLRLTPEETGQFFHARMLQSLGRMRMDTPPDLSMTADQMHQVMEALPAEAEEAVARLVGLGFERGRVIEAYIACDQDEMLAANLLMDQ